MSSRAGEIETARLRIRGFCRADSEPFISFMADSESTEFLPFPQEQKTAEGARQLLEATIESYDSDRPMSAFAIEERGGGRFVGFCGLHPHDEETAEIMYAVMPAARRRGYATEIAGALSRHALEKLGYRRVIAFVVPANEPSKTVAARAGFRDGGLVENANFEEKVHRYVLEREHL